MMTWQLIARSRVLSYNINFIINVFYHFGLIEIKTPLPHYPEMGCSSPPSNCLCRVSYSKELADIAINQWQDSNPGRTRGGGMHGNISIVLIQKDIYIS